MNEGIIEAVVQVGEDETRYLRCGRGGVVVVVLTPDGAERARLIRRYAPEYRVIAPAAESCPALCGGDPATLDSWLQGLIEGLGLEAPVVALSPAVAHLAPHAGGAAEVLVAAARDEGS